MWHTPHAWTFTTTSPGPGSGTITVSTVTGAPLAVATTPRTSLAIGALPSRGFDLRWGDAPGMFSVVMSARGYTL